MNHAVPRPAAKPLVAIETASTERLSVKVGATWVAFAVALFLELPRPVSAALYLAGCAIGFVLCVVGLVATREVRGPLPTRNLRTRLRLAAGSLVLGVCLGAVLLFILWLVGRKEPALAARFSGRLHEPAWRPWALAFESSILEEIVFRLAVLGCIAWLVSRFSPKNSGRPFVVGLIGSTLVFGLAHLPAWAAATSLGWLLVVVVLALNGIGAIAFGWLFWRCGLGYAVLCHFAGDVVIQALGPKILA